MKTHEEEVQDIVGLDYEILDVKLEKQLRDWYKERNLVLLENIKPALLNTWWMLYVQRN